MRCNPKSNQLTDILFIFTWGKWVWGGGWGPQPDPAAAAAIKQESVGGEGEGTRAGRGVAGRDSLFLAPKRGPENLKERT